MAILEDNTLHFYVNGHDQGIAYENIPQPAYPLVNLSERITSITIVGKFEIKDIVDYSMFELI